MTTTDQSSHNQQLIAEHIVNIDTTAENISAINSVANIVTQLVSVAGMLPDIAATVSMRSALLSVAKKLTVVQSVADAVPLLDAVRNMESDIRAALTARTEIASVVAHLDAVRNLAAHMDILIQSPQHAADAKAAANAANGAASQIVTQLDEAKTARLGAELAENEAKAAAGAAVTSCDSAAAAADAAKQSAAAAAAISGLPDANATAPGNPLIWDGNAFAMGTLANTLTSVNGELGVADSLLASIQTAQTTASALSEKITQAHDTATDAKNTADGIDAKVTQAQADAATAKADSVNTGANVVAFGARLATAENETFLLGQSQSAHSTNGDIHHSTIALVERINNAVTASLAELRDNGTGTLPETHNTLQKLTWLLDALATNVNGFLLGEGDGNRLAMLNAIDVNRVAIANIQGGLLLKSDIADDLGTSDAAMVLSANQGVVLSGLASQAQRTADAAVKPWIQVLESVPAAWPESAQWGGLIVVCTKTPGDAGENPLVNPQWYVNDRGVPMPLVRDATGIRLLDGTTVQTGLAASLVASQAAQAEAAEAKADAATAKATAESIDEKATAAQDEAAEAKVDAATAKATAESIDEKATAAQAEASEAKADAATAKATAESIDEKATAAQAEAAEAKADAATAKATAESINEKATAAQAEAAEAKADAATALAKMPNIATQTTVGIVKGSDTIRIEEGGILHAVPTDSIGAGGTFVGQWVFLRQSPLPPGYIELDGTLYASADEKFPELLVYLTTHQNEITTETDWQARSAAASGTGGVPFYVYDAVENTLRMPDTRGDSPYHGTVGTWEGDAIRNVKGNVGRPFTYATAYPNGPFYITAGGATGGATGWAISEVGLDLSLAVPTDSTNHPRRIGLTFAVYAGIIGAL